VRVRQHGGTAEDISKESFSITVPGLLAAPTLVVPTTSVNVTASGALELANDGTAPVTITSITTDDGQFWPGRTWLVIGAGEADTVGMYYRPGDAGYDTTTVTLVGNDPGSPHVVEVTARGVPNVGVDAAPPRGYALWQPTPNPFASRTMIRYALPARVRVRLAVYNVKGERVATLVDREQDAGEYSVPFGALSGRGPLAAGIYFCRLEAGAFTAARRMVLMR
jgi:hypothetical protein